MKTACFSAGIRLNAVMCNGGMQPHKADVMMQAAERIKSSVQPFFQAKRGVTVQRFMSGVIHLPHQTAPEPVDPVAQIGRTVVRINTVHWDVGDFSAHAQTLCMQLAAHFFICCFRPFLLGG